MTWEKSKDLINIFLVFYKLSLLSRLTCEYKMMIMMVIQNNKKNMKQVPSKLKGKESPATLSRNFQRKHFLLLQGHKKGSKTQRRTGKENQRLKS